MWNSKFSKTGRHKVEITSLRRWSLIGLMTVLAIVFSVLELPPLSTQAAIGPERVIAEHETQSFTVSSHVVIEPIVRDSYTVTAPPPPPPPPPKPVVSVDPGSAQGFAKSLFGSYGWGDEQLTCLVNLWNRESGWRADAANSSSGAYGIPQALPGSKMATAGADWETNGNTQVRWGLGYISSRYSNPCGAWAHSESVGWY